MKLKERIAQNNGVKRESAAIKKTILLIKGGAALSLTNRPDYFFKIANGMAKEWREINRKTLINSIKRLYQSKLIDYKENDDGTVSLILADNGKKRVLRYDIDGIKIKTPARWDGLWRLVMFDIPENLKNGRNALAAKLKEMGFQPMQKSVFIFPYPCQNELDFIIEIFDLRKYVRFALVKEMDIDADLKHKFNLE